MMQVKRIAGREAIAPVIEGESELSGPRRRLRLSADRLKPEVGAPNQNRRPLRVLGRGDLAVGAVIGYVDPVVDAQPGIRDVMLRVLQAESGVEHLAHVGLAVII